MTFLKKVLCDVEMCYSLSVVNFGGKNHYLFASEKNGGQCKMVDEETLAVATVWEKPGGTMAMEQVPGFSGGDFLAVMGFSPVFAASQSELNWITPQNDGSFAQADFLKLPYLHRFSFVASPVGHQLVLATLCTAKTTPDDWSSPGKIYAASFVAGQKNPPTIRPILSGLTKNHGFCKGELDGKEVVLVTADEGAFCLTPPQKEGEDWQIATLLDHPISDIALVDIDGDGEKELVTIEPFHGASLKIYKKQNGAYRPIYEHPDQLPFAHALWAGEFNGEPTIFCGYREGEQALFSIRYGANGFMTQVIDTGVGPSNITVVKRLGQDVLLAANRALGQGVLYLPQK